MGWWKFLALFIAENANPSLLSMKVANTLPITSIVSDSCVHV